MNVKGPLVSIIVPIYNVETYIEKCLDSILTQTYTQLEVILVNDGSKDSSGKIAKEYALTDQRICYIEQENQGVSCARNKGVEQARGKYILFVDSDDWIEDNLVEECVKIAIHNEADLVEFGIQWVNSTNGKKIFSKKVETFDNLTTIDMLFKKEKFYIAAWNRLYRKDLIQNLKFPEGKKHEDIDYTLRVLYSAQKIVYYDAGLYNYVQHLGSIMNSGFKIDMFKDKTEILEQLIVYFKDRKEQKIVDSLYRMIFMHILDFYHYLWEKLPEEEFMVYKNKIRDYYGKIESLEKKLIVKYKLLIWMPKLYFVYWEMRH